MRKNNGHKFVIAYPKICYFKYVFQQIILNTVCSIYCIQTIDMDKRGTVEKGYNQVSEGSGDSAIRRFPTKYGLELDVAIKDSIFCEVAVWRRYKSF